MMRLEHPPKEYGSTFCMTDLYSPTTCESPESVRSADDSDACITAALRAGSQATSPAPDELLHHQNHLTSLSAFSLNPNEPMRGLQELVQELVIELEGGKRDLNRLYNIMMSYDASGNEWKRFEYWDAEKRYTRNLIVSVPGVLTVMLLCWNPSKGSPIHAHASSECFMRILSGRIVETQYVVRGGEGDVVASDRNDWKKKVVRSGTTIPSSDLIQAAQRTFSPGEVTFINDSLGVHQVENPFEEGAVTLHCYVPGYDTCKSWVEEVRPSDPQPPHAYVAADASRLRVQEVRMTFDTSWQAQ